MIVVVNSPHLLNSQLHHQVKGYKHVVIENGIYKFVAVITWKEKTKESRIKTANCVIDEGIVIEYEKRSNLGKMLLSRYRPK